MDETERLTIDLPVEQLAEAMEAVEAGEFPSVDAAVASALEAWTIDRMVARIGIKELRRRWDEGIASGDPRPLDFDEFRQRLAKAFAEAKANA